MNLSSPALAIVKSPISLPNSLSIGVSTMRPVFGMRLVISRLRNSSAPAPDTSYLAKLAISVTPTRSRVARTSLPTCSKSLERWKETMSFGSVPFGANQSGVSSPQLSPMTALLRDHGVVERRGLRRARGRQFLVGEADREAARIVLAHLGVGVAQASPIRRSARRPCPRRRSRDRRAIIQLDSARPTPPPWLKPAMTRAGAPEVGQALHRPDQRVAVGREGEGAVDDLLDAGVRDAGEMLEADLQRRRDAVEVGLQQLVAEIPRRVDRRPRLAGLLVGAEQDAVALLARVDLALEVEHADHLAAGLAVEGLDLRHRLGEQVHVLHGEHRQLEADHAADLARPQAAAVDDVLGLDRALFGDDVPGAVGVLRQFDDRLRSTISAPSFCAALA